MKKNTYKVRKKTKSSGVSMFSFIENRFSLDSIFENGIPLNYLPYILFVMALGIFYIGNNHYTEKTVRKVTKIEREVQDLKADYRTLQADYMHARLQSEVAKRVKPFGLNESSIPPKKIIVAADEH